MSQRTPAPTIAAAMPTPKSAGAATSASASKPAKAEVAQKPEKAARSAKTARAGTEPESTQSDAPASVLAPETLARTLRAVADELERDPALARRVAAAIRESLTVGDGPLNVVAEEYAAPAAEAKAGKGPKPARAFRPTLVTGASPELGAGVIDPFALRQRLGADGLRRALGELRLGSLRAIIREHRLDPKGKLVGVNDAARLRNAILDAVGS